MAAPQNDITPFEYSVSWLENLWKYEVWEILESVLHILSHPHKTHVTVKTLMNF